MGIDHHCEALSQLQNVHMPSYTPNLLQHINLTVPSGSLGLATEFYGEVIGFASDQVPALQRDSLLW